MKKISLFLCTMFFVTFVLCACSSKKSDDPIATIQNLSEEISSNGDEWSEKEWNEAADKLKEAIDELPTPLETDEELKLSSAIFDIEYRAESHERKAAKMLQVLKDFKAKQGKEETSEPSLDGSHDLTGTVDKYPITMHLDINGESVSGTYYYDKKGPDAKLNLSGKNSDGELDVNETTADGTPTGHFKGKMENGVFKGKFILPSGKKMSFIVSEAGADVSSLSIDDVDEDMELDGMESSESETAGDESIDELLNEYEEYWQHYMSFIKKMDKDDPTALAEYAQIYKKLMDMEERLGNVKGELSTSQLQRMNNIHIKLMQEAQKMQ